MAVLKRYTAEHHSAIAAARQELYDVTTNSGRNVPTARKGGKRPAKKADEKE
ncbi:hypothetical protein Loshitsa2_00038 [Erwinia phage Loshitsa2]|uniref:Uncharacterized protein n=2 Tax=Micantvirus TaxID=3424950 RepID=A0AAE9FNV5_9CAUD|nr:hypothetical protein Micant_00038 [Erwinia phage Micant]UNA01166.1 hypothetical protein Loshitsa2_00038 [Erwinia phage Loshitsa2]